MVRIIFCWLVMGSFFVSKMTNLDFIIEVQAIQHEVMPFSISYSTAQYTNQTTWSIWEPVFATAQYLILIYRSSPSDYHCTALAWDVCCKRVARWDGIRPMPCERKELSHYTCSNIHEQPRGHAKHDQVSRQWQRAARCVTSPGVAV